MTYAPISRTRCAINSVVIECCKNTTMLTGRGRTEVLASVLSTCYGYGPCFRGSCETPHGIDGRDGSRARLVRRRSRPPACRAPICSARCHNEVITHRVLTGRGAVRRWPCGAVAGGQDIAAHRLHEQQVLDSERFLRELTDKLASVPPPWVPLWRARSWETAASSPRAPSLR
jgi:hypothetical protein